MTAYLSEILTTYNNHAATPAMHEPRKALSHKAFRGLLTLAAGYIGTAANKSALVAYTKKKEQIKKIGLQEKRICFLFFT